MHGQEERELKCFGLEKPLSNAVLSQPLNPDPDSPVKMQILLDFLL